MLLSVLFCFPLQIQAQKFLKKTLRTSDKYYQEKDGFEFKWYEYSYLQGQDTLYAAFGLNGKRITPNSIYINNKHSGHKPYYCGGGIFMCDINTLNNWGENNCVGYNLNGEKVFPESLEARVISYQGGGIFTLEKRSNSGNLLFAAYNSSGECMIPFSMGYNSISFFPEYRAFWCDYFDGFYHLVECHTYSADAQYYAIGEYYSSGAYDKTSWYRLNDPEDLAMFNKYKKRVPFSTSSLFSYTINSNNNVVSSSSTDISSESGLLYKGDYTVSGQGTTDYPTISIYEDRLCGTIDCFNYKSTNSRGERVYKGTETFGAECTYYVSANYNIRLVKSYYNPYTSGYENVTFSVTKGTSRMPTQQGGNVPSGGNSEYQWQEHGATTNPVQPHQVTTSCTSCQGSGKCPTCNGKHWYYGIGGSKVTCPNCTPNGACSSCGGSGKKTSTKYY